MSKLQEYLEAPLKRDTRALPNINKFIDDYADSFMRSTSWKSGMTSPNDFAKSLVLYRNILEMVEDVAQWVENDLSEQADSIEEIIDDPEEYGVSNEDIKKLKNIQKEYSLLSRHLSRLDGMFNF